MPIIKQINHKLKMKKHIITLIILSISNICSAQKQKNNIPEKPKLIVNVVIEGMRYDYLYRWADNFTENGFKLLMNKGTVCENAEYKYTFTQTSTGMATIVTGCEPSAHGIIADRWYKRINNKVIDAVYDPKIAELETPKSSFSYSPHLLQATSFSDEMKIFNQYKSMVISLSLKPTTAVMGGGQIANGAYWLNTKSGKFTTSSYYLNELPEWVKTFNNKNLPALYVKNAWQPLLSDEHYINRTFADTNQTTFVNFAKKQPSNNSYPYKKLTASPYGVGLLKDLAILTIMNNKLGKTNYTDYLNICFTAPAEANRLYGTNSKELEDMYLRLDRELAHLFKYISTNIGLENTLIILTSTNGATYSPNELKEHNINVGYFDGSRASTLVQTYLSAIYGKGKWISSYDNKQVYLNRLLIEEKSLNLREIQEQTARFFTQFTGVANAITSSTLENTFFNSGIFSYMQNSYNPKRSGDVLINLKAGWKEKSIQNTLANSGYKSDTHVPLIFCGWKIPHKTITRSINICDIAPTIAFLLNIPVANGSSSTPIIELKEQ